MKTPDFLIRDKHKRSFKWWIKHYKALGGEYAELGEQTEASVPVIFATFYPQYTMNDIENMSFRDVTLKLAVIEKRLEAQGKITRPSGGRGNSIINTAMGD